MLISSLFPTGYVGLVFSKYEIWYNVLHKFYYIYNQHEIAVNVTVQSYQLWQLSRDSVLMVSKISGNTAQFRQTNVNLMVLRSIDFLRVNFVVLAQISYTLEGKRSGLQRFY